MQDFSDAGLKVYALSYDEPDALRDFKDAHNITYTLLSDPESSVIRSFGILNTLIDENDHPWFGIPYPGTYIIDAAGTITHKFFDSNLAVRAGPEQLLRAAQGHTLERTNSDALTSKGADLEGADVVNADVEDVDVSVFLDGDSLKPTVQRDLVARFRVPARNHVYASPAPEGSIAVDLTIENDPRLVQRPLNRPASEPHELAGSGERFEVHHNEFELRLPLTVNSAVSSKETALMIKGVVRWQSCDDEVCGLPASRPFELSVPIGKAPAVALSNGAGRELEPNAMAHFQKMTTRRTKPT